MGKQEYVGSITQVGSATRRMAEIVSRIRYLQDRPELRESHPDEYRETLDLLISEFAGVFDYEKSKDAWHWHTQQNQDKEQS